MCRCREHRVVALGRDARLLRMGVGDCPFPFGDPDATFWVRGWNEEDLEITEALRAYELQSIRERIVR